MALVSEGRSTLNPNAPLFVPASLRQVEDFSTEWWNLVTTSTWFRDYWLSQYPGDDTFGDMEDGFIGNSTVLPDTIDLDMDDDILNMEAQFEEFLQSSEAEYGGQAVGGMTKNGLSKSSDALVKMNLPKERVPKSPREPMRHWEKPVKHVSVRCSPRFIQQPR